ncbi:hypothetical protein Bca52824_023240 [Brassica carinata]|uniref:Uncharacterized protein n=1 Tax=Brassica carinata TaxID=52824 RepID=A0A8X7VI95_BRACI|nr:hypothetical protein Bca52824_023240 [Brassica carinata]
MSSLPAAERPDRHRDGASLTELPPGAKLRSTQQKSSQPGPDSQLRTRDDNYYNQGREISLVAKRPTLDGRIETQKARKPHRARRKWRGRGRSNRKEEQLRSLKSPTT